MDTSTIALTLIVGLVAVVIFFATRRPNAKPQIVVVGKAGGGVSNAKPVAATAAAAAAVPKGPKVAIYFGSQTGTAEGFANKLAEEFKDRSFDAKVIDLDEFDEQDFVEHENVVLAIATYGEGEPTDNGRNFHKWITDKSLDENLMANTNFLVFGLGNRQYDHYQAMGILADTRLEQLGAKRIFRRGEGDDDGSIEDDFAAWREEMWPELMKFFGMSDKGVVTSSVHKFRLLTTWHTDGPLPMTRTSSSTLESHHLVHAVIARNDELHTSLSTRSCRHIELDISNTDIHYETGDHVAIAPHNPPALVSGIAARLSVDPSAQFSIVDPLTQKSPFPCPCSIHTALSEYLEINSIKKSLLPTVAEYAENEGERVRLRAMGEKEGRDEFEKYAIAGMRTMLDLLLDFPSVKMPVDKFLELMPRLQLRYYSIASSSKVFPKSIHVAASVERVTGLATTTGEFNGVCTTYLSQLRPGSTVNVYVRHSTFKLPTDLSTSIIMVGPGTGFAPLRGFMQELSAAKDNNSQELGQNMLFFGCQNRQHDLIYEDEMIKAAENGVFWRTHFAFSREQANKIYVQHKIEEDKDTVLSLLEEKSAYLYICGASRMAKDVRLTIIKACTEKFGWTQEKGEAWLHDLQKSGRFQQDVW